MWALGPTLQAGSGNAFDPYAPNTVLQISRYGGGPIDDSMFGRVFTPAGNAQISSAQSKFGTSSMLFDGNTDMYSVGMDPGFVLPSAYTWECWIYPTSLSQAGNIMAMTENNVASFAYWCVQTSPSQLVFTTRPTNAGAMTNIVGGVLKTNTWQHVAVSVNGPYAYLLLDGVVVASSSSWPAYSTAMTGFAIGNLPNGYSPTTLGYAGYVDGVRLTKGVCRYAPAVRPPTTTLPYQGEAVVLNFDGANNSTSTTDLSGKTWTFNGNAKISTTTFQLGTSALDLDGTGDYLTTSDHADFSFGTDDFTVELWAKWRTLPASGAGYDPTRVDALVSNYTPTGPKGWCFQYRRDTTDRLSFADGNTECISYAWTPTVGVWYHIALVRFSGRMYLFLNGTQVSAAVYTAAVPSTATDRTLSIGSLWDGNAMNHFLDGQIDGFRIAKGVAKYFPSALSLVAPAQAADTSTLLTFDTDLSDATGKTYSAYGNAAVSATRFRFGTKSLALDGNGDYITTPSHTAFDFGNGDFTITFSIYLTSLSATTTGVICRDQIGGTRGWLFFMETTSSPAGKMQFAMWDGGSSYLVTDVAAVGTGAWVTFTAVRKGSVVHLFRDGMGVGATSVGTATIGAPSQPFVIGCLWGASGPNAGSNYLNGNIDGVHIIKGRAVFPAEWNTPTKYRSAIPPKYTKYASVIHCDERSTGEVMDDILKVSWTKAGSVAFGYPGICRGWMSFSGALADVVTSPPIFGPVISGDWTWEAWVNITNASKYNMVFNTRSVGSAGIAVYVGALDNPATITLANNVNVCAWGGSVSTNVWYHVAVTRNATTKDVKVYLNGVFLYVYNDNRTYDGTTITMGSDVGNISATFYMDGVSFHPTIKYQTNFTPPGVPPYVHVDPLRSAVVAHLPLNGANSGTQFIDTCGNSWTRTNATTSTTQSRFHGSSGYFSGTGYLTHAASSMFGFGTGDFTVEAWIYPTTLTGANRAVFCTRTSDTPASTPGIFFADSASSYKLAFYDSTTKLGGTGTAVVINQWQHVVLQRKNGVLYCYLDGIFQWSAAYATSFAATPPMTIGGGTTNGSNPFIGYIADFRVTKGVARYPEAKSIPTTALTLLPGDVSVLNFEGANNDTTTTDLAGRTWTFNGDAKISTAQSAIGSSSLYLDGTGDYLSTPSHADYNFGTGDFTVEFWMRSSASTGVWTGIVGSTRDSDVAGRWTVFNRTNLASVAESRVCLSSNDGSTWIDIAMPATINPNDNTWHHVAFCRRGTAVYGYFDGALAVTSTVTSGRVFGTSSKGLDIGLNRSDSAYYAGYIDGLRITKGYARYTPENLLPLPRVGPRG